jgi:hypothetical protein
MKNVVIQELPRPPFAVKRRMSEIYLKIKFIKMIESVRLLIVI